MKSTYRIEVFMKRYIGTDISAESLNRLVYRMNSEDKMPRNITMKDIIAVYQVLANCAFSPKELSAQLPNVSLKKIRYCIHFMLRYNMIKAIYVK
jgi:hypothetical protein